MQLRSVLEKVRYPREAVLDGENLDAIAARASRQADGLASSAMQRYDVWKSAHKLKSTATRNRDFDWTMFGRVVGTCFNSVPRVNFMNGLVDRHVAEDQKRGRKNKRQSCSEEDGEEERP